MGRAEHKKAGALTGIRVLDLTHVLAGPFCSYQLALLGADVIKVEPPAAPDCARGRGPDDRLNALGLGLNYQVQGANKRALAVDVSAGAGRDILLRLAATTEVFLENYATGALDRLGLGFGAVAAVRPDVVYCSMTGYGGEGPESRHGAYDNTIQAASGIIGQCGGVKPGLSFVDYAAGYSAAFAIAAALVQRERTGQGAHVTASMLEVAMTLMAPEAAAVQHGAADARGKEAGISSYETADGVLMLGAFRPEQYRTLGVAMADAGHPIPGLDDIGDWPDVWAASGDLKSRLAEVFATAGAQAWAERLHAHDLPAEPVRRLDEAVRSEQLAARGFFVPSPEDAGVTLPQAPYRMSSGGPALRSAPPRLGADTDAILQEIGLSSGEIAALRAQEVVA